MIYLASNSPRRAALLSQMGVEFSQLSLPEHFAVDETALPLEQPVNTIERLALAKARAGFAYLQSLDKTGLVLGGDTDVVSQSGALFGKPQDSEHAALMLQQLSDTWHFVYSAVAVVSDHNHYCALASTRVFIRRLTRRDIDFYIQSGEPFGKAGGYAIQGLGARFIERIEGSYSAVMGLPLFETAHVLERAAYRFGECL